MFLVYILLFVLSCLERLVSEMTECVEWDVKLYSVTYSTAVVCCLPVHSSNVLNVFSDYFLYYTLFTTAYHICDISYVLYSRLLF